jgi:tetratricopeptide (TPR) repeat protein
MNRLNKLLLILITAGFSLSVYAQQNASDCFALYKKEEYAEAFDCMNSYIRKNPKDVDALTYRAGWYAQVKDYKRAFADINEAIKNYDKDAGITKDMLYTLRGLFYCDIDNYDEALNDYSTAIKLNPENTNVLFDRSYIYYELKNYTASDADLKQILKIEKGNIDAAIKLARNMVAKGQIDEAIKELDRLEKIDAGNTDIYLYRAEAYDKKEDYRKAIDNIIDRIYYSEFNTLNSELLLYYAEYEFTYAIAKVS